MNLIKSLYKEKKLTLIYFVAIKDDIVKAFEDKIFIDEDDAKIYCHQMKLLNRRMCDKLKVYKCLVTNITEVD